MSITNKRNCFQTKYIMAGQLLTQVTTQDYLGVTISNKLQWGPHVNKIAKSASSKLGLLQRTMHSCPPSVKTIAYKTIVRPKLEYASSAWNPYYRKDIQKLENIQRRAARFVHNDYHQTSSPSDMISALNWDSLQHRRLINQTVMFYKILTGQVLISLPHSVSYVSHDFNLRYLTPNRYLHTCTSTIQAHQHSFFPSMCNVWNHCLPDSVLNAKSCASFKSQCRAALPVKV